MHINIRICAPRITSTYFLDKGMRALQPVPIVLNFLREVHVHSVPPPPAFGSCGLSVVRNLEVECYSRASTVVCYTVYRCLLTEDPLQLHIYCSIHHENDLKVIKSMIESDARYKY